ncbi:MAG TPA: redox-regulated ATPase YchF [Candidatus Bathyarchaeia archaeon]|nr:redox-regulated ATPase YchF [Candidatus Bathyarchaeia archaeon]
MSLSVGIVGLPNAGKSTLFNALLGCQIAEVAERPFTTIEPNTGVVVIPDSRLERLGQLIKPEKLVSATIKFIDIAGLVKGAHKGEGLGNQFLSQIRFCDAILHLVRAFSNPRVVRPEESLNPLADAEIVNLEMALADLEIVERSLIEAKKKARVNSDMAALVGVLEKIKAALGKDQVTIRTQLTDEEKEIIKELNLLTLKPMIYILNVDESGRGQDKNLPSSFPVLEICAALQAELTGLENSERQEFAGEFGLEEGALNQLIKEAYQLLDLITFYTIKGGKEVHAWPIRKGTKAVVAAGQVHTDMARGFIKAEVINVDQLLSIGSWQRSKELGKLQLQGKDYKVTDGDVVEFKFSN